MIEEIIDVSRDAKLIKTAVGGDAKSVAFKYGKHVNWVKRQYNTEYTNFWTVTKRWIHAFAKVNIDKAELFFKDFELLKHTLYTEAEKIPAENIVLIEKDVAQYF